MLFLIPVSLLLSAVIARGYANQKQENSPSISALNYTNANQVQNSPQCIGGTSFGTNCYYLQMFSEVSWQDCRSKCASMSYSMLCIDSSETNAWLKSKLPQKAWIGYTDIAFKGTKDYYYWYPGCSSFYTNWDLSSNPKQPDNKGNNEDFAGFSLDVNTGQWNDFRADIKASCSCQTSLDRVQTCASGWLLYGTTCYRFKHVTSATWIKCYEACNSLPSFYHITMLCIRNDVENEWVYSNAGDEAWIGYTDDSRYAPFALGLHSKHYGWVAGCTSTYSNFKKGQPDNRNNKEDYAGFWKNTVGQWNDFRSDITAPCGCQYSL